MQYKITTTHPFIQLDPIYEAPLETTTEMQHWPHMVIKSEVLDEYLPTINVDIPWLCIYDFEFDD